MTDVTNPYQPPQSEVTAFDPEAPLAVRFTTTPAQRRHATDQYLLHWHPRRLLFGSLAMIAISGVLFVQISNRLGPLAFWSAFLLVSLIVAGIYTLLVRRTRYRISKNLIDSGLASNEPMMLHSDLTQLRLVQANDQYTWPNEELKVYGTQQGLLICPQPLLFVFVPKKSDFQTVDYDYFVKAMRSRAAAESLDQLSQ